jgi:hypothetical protein
MCIIAVFVLNRSQTSFEDYLRMLKKVCAACRKPIVGRSMSALNRVWHPEHFVCAHCHEPFGESNFWEKDGLPYW